MSTYYDFYLGKKENGIVSLVYSKPLYWRSGGFIEGDDFVEAAEPLPLNEVSEKDKNLMRNLFEDYSNGYYLSLSTLHNLAKRKGLRQGYVPLYLFDNIIKNGYIVDNEWDIEMICAEQYAEMDRISKVEYGKMAFLAVNSTDYIANLLCEMTRNYIEEEGYCVILVRN